MDASALGLPPNTRACLFDLDGVLTQTAKLHALAWKQALDSFLRRRGEPFVPFELEDYSRYVDGKLRSDGARAFLASRGITLPDAEVEALARHKDDLLVTILGKRGVETYP